MTSEKRFDWLMRQFVEQKEEKLRKDPGYSYGSAVADMHDRGVPWGVMERVLLRVCGRSTMIHS